MDYKHWCWLETLKTKDIEKGEDESGIGQSAFVFSVSTVQRIIMNRFCELKT